MENWIWLDMDGTFVNLYGVDGWLSMLIAEDTTPYEVAKPMHNMSLLARLLNRAKEKGWNLGIISWTSKNGSETFNKAVKAVKIKWVGRRLHSVDFDRIDIVDYGTPKEIGRSGVLFDDEEPNRANWNGQAYEPSYLIEFLKTL